MKLSIAFKRLSLFAVAPPSLSWVADPFWPRPLVTAISMEPSSTPRVQPSPTPRLWCSILCCGLYVQVCFETHWMIYSLLPFRMDTLAAGALIALNRHRFSRRNAILGATVVLFAGLGGIIWLAKHQLSGSSNIPTSNVVVYESTLFIVTGVFLLALFGIGKSVLCFAPIRWPGTISYSVYLFHVTAIYLAFRASIAPTLQPLMGALLTVGYATGMWFLVERPILNFGKTQP